MSDIPNTNSTAAEAELKIAKLEAQLLEVKAIIKDWNEALADLSLSAAKQRAQNQGSGRGFLGGFLGPKYRKIVRAGAAASNAAISKNLAERRGHITEKKRQAQDVEKVLKLEIREAKALLRESKQQFKKPEKPLSEAARSIELLKKLKEAHELGLLTDTEFELKRQSLVSKI